MFWLISLVYVFLLQVILAQPSLEFKIEDNPTTRLEAIYSRLIDPDSFQVFSILQS